MANQLITKSLFDCWAPEILNGGLIPHASEEWDDWKRLDLNWVAVHGVEQHLLQGSQLWTYISSAQQYICK